jgi:hypothetical protein
MAVMAVTTVASTAYSITTQRAEGRYRKGVADYNARVSENEAQETRRAGVEAENIQRRKTAELLSKQRAQLGAAGVELGTGSPLQLQEETVALGEADALRIRSNYEARAESLETGAELTRSKGAFAESSAKAKATGTLLSGAGEFLDTGVADKWFTPDSAGKAPSLFSPQVTSQPSVFNP